MEKAPHILVVDDDPEIRNGLSKFLKEQGLRAVGVANGREMQKKLAKASIDLIVLDLMLPGENGLSLCKKVAAETDVPVILLTAVAGEADRIVGLEIGAEDYVCKPFSPRELLARIRVVLRRRHAPTKNTAEKRSTRFSFADW